MKRWVLGGSILLVWAALVIGAPATGASVSASRGPTSADVVQCEKVAKGHAAVTQGDITACKATELRVVSHCPKTENELVVKVNETHYALRRGHKPTTVTSLCNPAPTTAVTTPPTTTSANAQLVSSYGGTATNGTASDETADLTLSGVVENPAGAISGELFLSPQLLPASAPFSGTVSGSAVTFAISYPVARCDAGECTTTFTGTVNPSGTLSGTFLVTNVIAGNQSGTWQLQPT